VVVVTEREKWGVRVPQSDQDRYHEFLKETYPQIRPYAGTELERAVRQLLADVDASEGEFTSDLPGTYHRDLAAMETQLDRLLGAAAAGDESAPEKKSGSALVTNVREEGGSVLNCRVDPDVKDEFLAFADTCDARPGRLLGVVMRTIVTGETERRLRDKTERLVEEAGELLERFGGESSPGPKERRALKIAKELEFPFTRDDLGAAIEAADVPNGDTAHSRDVYFSRVVDELNGRRNPVPSAPDEVIPASEAEGLVEKRGLGPTVTEDPARLKFHDRLTREERVRAIRVEACRRSASNGKGARLTADDLREYFTDRLGDLDAGDLLRGAAKADGFEYHDADSELLVRHSDVTDASLLVAAGIRDPVAGSPDANPGGDADVGASSDADPGGSAATAADGGLALDAATERLRDTFGGKDAPDLVRSEIANVSDGVAPEDVPDDAVREVRERLTAGGMDQLQAAEPANAPSD
jgi:hypothetical protein